ncbi:hypothetical protein SO802_016803 [Lithocarpus litseifolius]|uniref:DUF674 domain-containing protein n=1 Tax=Lithocarpus litseifolius TaxID=425828 RepID=A0AAW2CXH9_9ROSI
MASSKVSLKLLIDTKRNKVLFAEAGKDFVDFLFNLLSLPVGTVIRLLTKNSMVGSLGNLYGSVETLSETYLQPNQSKDAILKPKTPISGSDLRLLLSADETMIRKMFYMCPSFHRNVTDDPRAACPNCGCYMNTKIPYIALAKEASSDDEGGYVKGVVTYMVMDDLVVKPMSTISSIALLQKFSVKEVGALEERVVDLGMDEGLKLLKASLQSKTVLSSVFLRNMGA